MKDLSEAVVSHCIFSNAKIQLLEESESEYDSDDDDCEDNLDSSADQGNEEVIRVALLTFGLKR